jgi:hypothetical protein
MAVGDGVVSTGGIELHLTNSSDVLTKLVGLETCNRPTLTVEEAETTDQDSGGTKQFKPAMAEVPDLSARLKYEPGSATDLLILEHLASKEIRAAKLVIVEEDGTTQDCTFDIFLKTYVPDDGGLGNTRMATLTGRPTPITQAATA